MFFRLWLWGPVVAVMGTIFWLSSQSDPPAGPEFFALSDKIEHALAFGLLSAAWFRALAEARWDGLTVRRGALAVLGTVAYGVSDEWHQSFVPLRTADAFDVMADAGGAVVAALGVWVCGIIAARRRTRNAVVSRLKS